MLGLDEANLRTKFDNTYLSRSRDMVGAHRNLNGLVSIPTEETDIRTNGRTPLRFPPYAAV